LLASLAHFQRCGSGSVEGCAARLLLARCVARSLAELARSGAYALARSLQDFAGARDRFVHKVRRDPEGSSVVLARLRRSGTRRHLARRRSDAGEHSRVRLELLDGRSHRCNVFELASELTRGTIPPQLGESPERLETVWPLSHGL
jgi:hypothetical protein